MRCLVHPAKSSAPLSVCLSFGTFSWRSGCLWGGALCGDRDLGLLPLPSSGFPGSLSGGPPGGLFSSSGFEFVSLSSGLGSGPFGVSPIGAGVLPVVCELLEVPVPLGLIHSGTGDVAGATSLGFAMPVRFGGGDLRSDIYWHRQIRSYLRQSHGGSFSSWTRVVYLSLK